MLKDVVYLYIKKKRRRFPSNMSVVDYFLVESTVVTEPVGSSTVMIPAITSHCMTTF